MTVFEAIARLDVIKPNGYTDVDKIRWLSDLDGRIKTEIIDTHEGGDEIPFEGYTRDTDIANVNLLVSAPYDDIYIKYLEAQIDYANAEFGRYNNSIVAFNSSFAAYERYYNRHHMPNETKIKYF